MDFSHLTDICDVGRFHTSGTMPLMDFSYAFETVFLF